jgi:putative flippase GtrA
LLTFGAIGVVSTVAYVALYAWLRQGASAGIANATALLITAVGNTAANRRLTFAVKARDGLARDHAAGLAALGVALAITTASLGALDFSAPNHGRTIELAVLVGANGAATVARFVLLRFAIRAGHRPVSATAGLH